MIEVLETADFNSKVESADVVVVKFWADWCTQCDDVAPIIEEFAKTTDVPVYSVNIDEEGELRTKAGIKAIPALLFYKNGRIKNFIFGNTTLSQIERKLNMTKRS